MEWNDWLFVTLIYWLFLFFELFDLFAVLLSAQHEEGFHLVDDIQIPNFDFIQKGPDYYEIAFFHRARGEGRGVYFEPF